MVDKLQIASGEINRQSGAGAAVGSMFFYS
jgi:hypothetical protein